jgi:hypothetical protein
MGPTHVDYPRVLEQPTDIIPEVSLNEEYAELIDYAEVNTNLRYHKRDGFFNVLYKTLRIPP